MAGEHHEDTRSSEDLRGELLVFHEMTEACNANDWTEVSATPGARTATSGGFGNFDDPCPSKRCKNAKSHVGEQQVFVDWTDHDERPKSCISNDQGLTRFDDEERPDDSASQPPPSNDLNSSVTNISNHIEAWRDELRRAHVTSVARLWEHPVRGRHLRRFPLPAEVKLRIS